jgi:hypothetical protein
VWARELEFLHNALDLDLVLLIEHRSGVMRQHHATHGDKSDAHQNPNRRPSHDFPPTLSFHRCETRRPPCLWKIEFTDPRQKESAIRNDACRWQQHCRYMTETSARPARSCRTNSEILSVH